MALYCPWCKAAENFDIQVLGSSLPLPWTVEALKRHVKFCNKAPRPRGRKQSKGDNKMAEQKSETKTSSFSASSRDPQAWTGRTDNIIGKSLDASFWGIGNKLSGTVVGWREVTFTEQETKEKRSGIAYRLELDHPIRIAEEDETIVEIPVLAGIIAALKDLKAKGYVEIRRGDLWQVSCTGIRKAKRPGFSDSPEFEIAVIRK
jgi:hypothetical protein